MKRIIIALAVTTACLAATADTKIGLHIGSHHFPSRDFSNFNPGAYVRLDNGLTAGGFYNSERRASFYGGYTVEWGIASVTVGAITGYRRANVMPLVIPSLRIARIGQADIRLAYLPKITSDGAHVIHFIAEF